MNKHEGTYWECNECGCSFSGRCDPEELVDHYDDEHPKSPEFALMSSINDIFTRRVSNAIRRKDK